MKVADDGMNAAERLERENDALRKKLWQYGSLLRHISNVVDEFADGHTLDLRIIDGEVWDAIGRAVDEHIAAVAASGTGGTMPARHLPDGPVPARADAQSTRAEENK